MPTFFQYFLPFYQNHRIFLKYASSTWKINYIPRRVNSTLEKYNINLVVRGVSLQDYLKNIEHEYNVANKKISKNLNNDQVQNVITLLIQRKETVDELVSLTELCNESNSNKDLDNLIEEEKVSYENKLKFLDEELLCALLPTDENDECQSVVLEINAGVGGQEAMLFASELFNMYHKFAQNQGWTSQIADYASTDLGGIRNGTLLISGREAYKYFKHEGGVHRVQRIPTTEKAGRIHTSTVSVIALPEPSNIDIKIDNKDLKVETKRASGAGGQHVNTTDSAVRVIHVPTGVAVECQVDRSQIKNRQMALTKLRALLYQREMDMQIEKVDALRKGQVKSNFRNEKIRTYNFPQDRVTDHRLQGGSVHNIKGFFQGSNLLKELIDKLDFETRIERLLSSVNNFKMKSNK